MWQQLIKQRKNMHIKTIDIQQINTKYSVLFYSDVQELVEIRKNMHIKQSEMSFYCKVSLRTIQNFENYNCRNHKILFIYKEILNEYM